MRGLYVFTCPQWIRNDSFKRTRKAEGNQTKEASSSTTLERQHFHGLFQDSWLYLN